MQQNEVISRSGTEHFLRLLKKKFPKRSSVKDLALLKCGDQYCFWDTLKLFISINYLQMIISCRGKQSFFFNNVDKADECFPRPALLFQIAVIGAV